jgi:hypothetical protein
VTPAVYLADMIVVISDAKTGEPAVAVVVEPQNRDDKTKQISWPVYVTTARKANKCPAAILLAVCWDPVEAGKCRRAIRTGHPGFDLVPVVIDPYTTPGQANASPYLTIFAGAIGAIDLETENGRITILTAIREAGASDGDTRSLSTLIMGVASEAARQELEALMRTTPYRSDFIESFVEQGAAKAKAEGIVKILKSRDLQLTTQQLEQLAACTDLDQLDRWFDRSLTAKSAADVFQD